MYIAKNDKKNGKIVDISSKYDVKIVFDDKEDFESMMSQLAKTSEPRFLKYSYSNI